MPLMGTITTYPGIRARERAQPSQKEDKAIHHRAKDVARTLSRAQIWPWQCCERLGTAFSETYIRVHEALAHTCNGRRPEAWRAHQIDNSGRHKAPTVLNGSVAIGRLDQPVLVGSAVTPWTLAT